MDEKEQLAEEIKESSEQLFATLGEAEFYVTAFIVGCAVAIAWLMAVLIQRQVRLRLEKHPPKWIDSEILLKPLALLTPLLSVLYLGVARPLVQNYGNPEWLHAAIQLTLAYLAAKAVLMIMGFRLMGYFIATLILIITSLKVSGFLEPITSYFDSLAFHLGSLKISLLSSLQALIVLVLVFWAAGLLSHTLESYLRRSSMLSYNMRELTVKLFRVFLYFLAFIIALSSAGIDLTAFAVLGGAVGVGIGLGLQQLTSNFISGITLLMEKSIRLGDLVEIGTDLGWVRQLNIRYMLLETFDGKEIFIPNADFAEARVINWTHSNYRARVSFDVGVAYGSDPNKVIEILLECAQQHPLCIKDPEPAAFFREFGDSSLNFLLMFWIDDVREGRYKPQSDVMIAIYERFAQEGIEIPFPQRVVHMADGAPTTSGRSDKSVA